MTAADTPGPAERPAKPPNPVPGTEPSATTHPHPDPAGAGEIGHTHADLSGGWLRPAVFGAMDGLVTNISLVAGVGGARADAHIIVLTGLAGLVAGACSMALGEYTSVETQNNAVRAEAAVEKAELKRHPDAEEHELAGMYREMGLSPNTADLVAREIHTKPELAVRVHIRQELGVDPDNQPSPLVAGVSSFITFAIGAVFPLLPFLVGFDNLLAGLGVGGVGLFVAGALVARYTTRSWWLNGLRQLLLGATAAAATFLVGSLIGTASSG